MYLFLCLKGGSHKEINHIAALALKKKTSLLLVCVPFSLSMANNTNNNGPFNMDAISSGISMFLSLNNMSLFYQIVFL
jgi:hypothetical protein